MAAHGASVKGVPEKGLENVWSVAWLLEHYAKGPEWCKSPQDAGLRTRSLASQVTALTAELLRLKHSSAIFLLPATLHGFLVVNIF